MTENQIILSGWKDICEACGIGSLQTMKKVAQKYHMPIKRIDGKPIILKSKLIEWYNKLPD